MQTQILLSIKPEFSKKIFNGEKQFEFRKVIPKNHIEKVFIYESSPSKLIVGWFTIKRILSGPPATIWKICNHASGIDEEYFFAYCRNKELIYAIEIESVFEFKVPLKPHKLDSSFKAPQNFMFLDSNDKIKRVLRLFEEGRV